MNAFLEGWRRVLRAPAVTSGLLVGTVLLVAVTIPGRMNGSLLQGVTWVFAHEVFGFGAVAIVIGLLVVPAAFGAVWLTVFTSVLFWMFVSGGVLDRLARDRPTRTAAFFASSGVHFFRFLRLDAVIAVIPWLLLKWTTFQTTPSIPVRIGIVTALAAWSLVGDYAKVRIVVEDRHSAIGSLVGAVRFIVRHPLQTISVYLLNAAVMLGAVGIWRSVLPASGAWSGVSTWLLAMALYIVARLSFMASSIALFQSKLAHAGYVSAPLPIWPDSPSAEALQNLVDRKSS